MANSISVEFSKEEIMESWEHIEKLAVSLDPSLIQDSNVIGKILSGAFDNGKSSG